MPRAASSPRDPVGIASMSRDTAESPRRMTVPCPNCRPSCPNAASSAAFRLASIALSLRCRCVSGSQGRAAPAPRASGRDYPQRTGFPRGAGARERTRAGASSASAARTPPMHSGRWLRPDTSRRFERAAERSGARVGGGEEHARDPGLHDGSRAHGAGLQGHVEIRAGKAVVPGRAGRRPQRFDLGVGGRIARADGPIPPRAELEAVPHHHRTDRDLPDPRRPRGEGRAPGPSTPRRFIPIRWWREACLVTSTPTREIPGTSLTMRVDTASSSSHGRRAARRGHEVVRLDRAEDDDRLVAALVPHHPHRPDRQEHRERLSDPVVPPGAAQLFEKDRVRGAQSLHPLLAHLAQHAHGEPRPRERMTKHEVAGKPEPKARPPAPRP